MTFIISSAEGKAKVSETLVAYIAGCFVVFGAFGIWRFAVNTGNRIEDGGIASSGQQVSQSPEATVELKCNGCGAVRKFDISEQSVLEKNNRTI